MFILLPWWKEYNDITDLFFINLFTGVVVFMIFTIVIIIYYAKGRLVWEGDGDEQMTDVQSVL